MSKSIKKVSSAIPSFTVSRCSDLVYINFPNGTVVILGVDIAMDLAKQLLLTSKPEKAKASP
jgi:hypothetical protein